MLYNFPREVIPTMPLLKGAEVFNPSLPWCCFVIQWNLLSTPQLFVCCNDFLSLRLSRREALADGIYAYWVIAELRIFKFKAHTLYTEVMAICIG